MRSSLNLGDERLWKLYITLNRVEDAFRAVKTELGLRPFNHQLERRCRAHAWITILAYHLLRWTEFSLHLRGYECTWRRRKRRLQTHCYTTVIVPTSEGREHYTRRVGTELWHFLLLVLKQGISPFVILWRIFGYVYALANGIAS